MTTICHLDTGVEAEKYIGHFFNALGVVGMGGGGGGGRERDYYGAFLALPNKALQ